MEVPFRAHSPDQNSSDATCNTNWEASPHYVDLADKSVEQLREAYSGQIVEIVGKGSSALELATLLLRQANASLVMLVSPSRLYYAHETHYPGHTRAYQSALLDDDLLLRKVIITGGTGCFKDIPFARKLIRATGWMFNNSIFKRAGNAAF